MGCDIHQYILVWNKQKKEYESVEDVFGKWTVDKESFDMKPHPFPPVFNIWSRNYFFFGVLNGVRSDEFEIPDEYKCRSIPNGLPSSLDEIKDCKDYHSHVYFYVNDFIVAMQKTVQSIVQYINTEEELDEEEIHEKRQYDIPLLCRCKYTAESWKDFIDEEHPEYDYDKTILGFYFDN